jgi:hypothetical protein
MRGESVKCVQSAPEYLYLPHRLWKGSEGDSGSGGKGGRAGEGDGPVWAMFDI